VRKIGAGRARHVLLTGGIVSGRHAHELGIVDRVVASRDELDTAGDELARRLAGGGARALAATKGLLNELDGSLDASVGERGATLSAEVLATPEARAMLTERFGC